MRKGKLEKTIRRVYGHWKEQNTVQGPEHPDEDIFAAFIEHRLSEEKEREVKEHILLCERCSEIAAVSVSAAQPPLQNPPPGYLAKVRSLEAFKRVSGLLELVVRIREKALDMVYSSGDLLVGQELLPASVFRTRISSDFVREITALKDFSRVRVRVHLERQETNAVKSAVTVTSKQSHKCVRDIRITLLRDAVEMESYVTNTGSVVFENMLIGAYVVEVASPDEKLAVVLLEIQ